MPKSLASAELLTALFDEVIRGHTRVAVVHELYGGSAELSRSARAVLTAVVRAATPPTVPQIGRSLGYPRQTIQRQAEDLMRLGLVSFVDNPDHKRAKLLVPTPAGAAWYDRANRLALDWAAEFTTGLDAADLANAVATLREVRQRLEREARSPAANSNPPISKSA